MDERHEVFAHVEESGRHIAQVASQAHEDGSIADGGSLPVTRGASTGFCRELALEVLCLRGPQREVGELPVGRVESRILERTLLGRWGVLHHVRGKARQSQRPIELSVNTVERHGVEHVAAVAFAEPLERAMKLFAESKLESMPLEGHESGDYRATGSCSHGANETPTIAPSALSNRHTVWPQGSVRVPCSSS